MRRRWLSGLCVGALLVAALAPWRALIEYEMLRRVEATGLPLFFHVQHVSPASITLSDLSFGQQALGRLSLEFTPLALLRGELNSLQADAFVIHLPAGDIEMNHVQAMMQDEKEGKGRVGQWYVPRLIVSGAAVAVPELTAAGTLAQEGSHWLLRGRIYSPDEALSVRFSLDYPIDAPQKAKLSLHDILLPVMGGSARVRHIETLLANPFPIKALLRLELVSLEQLLKLATGEATRASGSVSGQLPLEILEGGALRFGKSMLTAGHEGQVQMPAEAIAGDQEQVALVRDVLKNFHYSLFTIALESTPHDTLSMLLSLRGYNPDVYNGREIRLNVRLNGDVMSLLTQSLPMLSNPQRFLENVDAP